MLIISVLYHRLKLLGKWRPLKTFLPTSKTWYRTWWVFVYSLQNNYFILGPVYTTPGKFENAALFLRLGLPSTLIRHENGAFRKRSSNRRNLKTPALRFSVDGKHFENGAFRKRWHHDENGILFPWPSFPQTQIQNDRWLLRFQISPAYCSVDGKHVMRFQSETLVLKFLRRSADGA